MWEKNKISTVLFFFFFVFCQKWTLGHGNLTFYVLYTQFRVFSSLPTSSEVRNTCAGGRECMKCLPSLLVGDSQIVHIPS